MPGAAHPWTRRRRSWSFPRDQIGHEDVAGRGPPRVVRPHDDRLARRQRDVELGQRRGRAIGVGGADDAVLAAPPAVAERGAEGVDATVDQVCHVERLHLEALAVGGEAGRQLEIAHTLAVDERLVEAMRGDVEHGGCDLAIDDHLAREMVAGRKRRGRDRPPPVRSNARPMRRAQGGRQAGGHRGVSVRIGCTGWRRGPPVEDVGSAFFVVPAVMATASKPCRS